MWAGPGKQPLRGHHHLPPQHLYLPEHPAHPSDRYYHLPPPPLSKADTFKKAGSVADFRNFPSRSSSPAVAHARPEQMPRWSSQTDLRNPPRTRRKLPQRPDQAAAHLQRSYSFDPYDHPEVATFTSLTRRIIVSKSIIIIHFKARLLVDLDYQTMK